MASKTTSGMGTSRLLDSAFAGISCFISILGKTPSAFELGIFPNCCNIWYTPAQYPDASTNQPFNQIEYVSHSVTTFHFIKDFPVIKLYGHLPSLKYNKATMQSTITFRLGTYESHPYTAPSPRFKK